MRPRFPLVPLLAAVLLLGCGSEPASQRDEPAAAPFRAEVEKAPVEGTEIAWYERGSGPPLVMLMGTGSTMAEWDPALLRLLAADHRLILLDYPGLGMSGPWRGDDFDSLADSVAGFMEEIGVPEADVLGWSMGGFVAQRLAVLHPERVTSVTLAGTNPGGTRAVLGTPEAQEIDSDPNPSDAQILRQLYPPGEQAEGRAFLRRLIRSSRSGEIPDDFDVPAATTDAQVAAEDPWLRSNANWRELAGVTAPVLVAAGRQDPVTPPPNARTIAARIPGSELLILPGAHAFLFSEREAFADAVSDLTG
jgi:pimeloyl-ACP methyl ester carboxylesterase